ncbi:hypothetical protein BEL04_11525 [Mucilaginibacter sp. PPCGB 2223]|uniref:sensor histidine kinase n=1 Tax=Mucilaginibacter sp. PPCGB 2223 TaxID=1886027 RepID=UPI0008246E32|nr:sensor histidine kinase [Mucilaginibacter sp. PPCGB 2223]OCX52118.1 hypothetical protein BEL04_11525 [Mucilaginibacter sp. PPCGB 2223]
MRLPLAVIIFLICQYIASAQAPARNDSARLRLLLKQSHSDSVRKDYLSAFKHLKRYVRLKDSMLDIAGKRQVSRLQTRFQTAKKDLAIKSQEKNITLLTNQNTLVNKNLGQTRLIRKIIVGLLIASALLLALSFWQYCLKLQANSRLQAQQDAINKQNESLLCLAGQKDELLEEKELLIKEIHHRVKNNLQVVISLLNTQSAYLNDPRAGQAIRQSQYRMHSISLIHQKLYQSESRALINMREYTQELIQYLKQSFDIGNQISIKLKIDDIELDVLRAVPLGLILNETITNALKYAFPADGSGYIKVALSCVNGKYLKLGITDNGPGMPPGFSINLCQSLGIKLIKSMCRQLGGRLDMRNENGLIVIIEFPMDNTSGETPVNDDISSFDDRVKLPADTKTN